MKAAGMKLWKSACMGFLLLAVFALAGGKKAYAAEDEEYTYTVRLYAGNQGVLTEDGIEVSSSSASVNFGRDCTEITGLKYGDAVYIRPQDAASSTDGKYYVRGVRRSGRDNSEAEAPTFRVACDRDYVVAYGISGDMAAYRVNYLDMDGNQIMESDTYYGNIGERQYVSSRYVEGYQPQALNMVKTISANEAENVFDFLYVPVGTSLPETAPPAPTEPAAEEGGGAAGPPEEDAGAEIPEEDIPLVGGDAGVNIPDDEAPQGQQELVDLDDENVPLANMVTEKQGLRMGYLPIYVGIGVAALMILGASAIYMKKRHKKPAVKADGEPETGESGQKKS